MAASVVFALSALALSAPAFAQETAPLDPTQEARDAAAGVDIGAGLTQQNVEDVVDPYETAAPTESTLSSATIENAIDERLLDQDDVGTQSHQDLVDSSQLRPDYALDRDSELNQHTQSIIDGAADATSEVFSETGTGICTEDTFENVPMFEAFCERTTVFEAQTCQVHRDITTDREDVFLCDIAPDVIERACDQELRIQCDTNDTCMADALGIAGQRIGPGKWSALYSFPREHIRTVKSPDTTFIKVGYNTYVYLWGETWENPSLYMSRWHWANSECYSNRYDVTFNVPPNVNLTDVSVVGLKSHRYFEMKVNGTVVFDNQPVPSTRGCSANATYSNHPDIDIHQHIQPGTNTISIDHISGRVGYVEFFLVHLGACCQNPQEYYEEVSCQE